MAITTVLEGTKDEPKIKIPKFNDDRYATSGTDTTTGASTNSVAIAEVPSGSGANITVTTSDTATPFNERTLNIRQSTSGTVIRDLKYDDVLGPCLKTGSSCFISGDGIYGGLINSGIWNSVGTRYTYTEYDRYGNLAAGEKTPSEWHSLMPWNMILPNCVGGARGRYQELIVDDQKYYHSQRGNVPSSDPIYWIDKGAFKYHKLSTSPKTGYKQAGTNLYLWEDADGEWGPKGGLWGWGTAKGDNAPPLPGAFITWGHRYYANGQWYDDSDDLSHIAFIEAVYNLGKDDCYIIVTESSYGDFSKTGILNMYRINKHNYPHDYYIPHHARWYNTRILYTPLCNFNSDGGLAFKQITLSYEAPPEEQQEAYNEIKEIIATQELKVGEKVQIEQFGNEKADGTGKKINRLLSIGYIKSIGAAGLPYKFEVVDKQTNGKLIGYYSREGLYKMAN